MATDTPFDDAGAPRAALASAASNDVGAAVATGVRRSFFGEAANAGKAPRRIAASAMAARRRRGPGLTRKL